MSATKQIAIGHRHATFPGSDSTKAAYKVVCLYLNTKTEQAFHRELWGRRDQERLRDDVQLQLRNLVECIAGWRL